jgi:cytochrome c peroxidase
MKTSIVLGSVAVCSGAITIMLAAAVPAPSQTAAAPLPVAPAPEQTAKENLGRLLFWDPILSGSKDTACATCHHPDFAYADGRDLSLGTGSVGLGPARAAVSTSQIPIVKRNSPTVLNVAYNGQGRRRGRRGFDGSSASFDQSAAPMLWDNRIRSLEAQALEPIKSFEEMRGTAYSETAAVDVVVARLKDIPEYVALFKQAFGPDASIDATRLGEAIAAFERALLAMNSPLDRFRAGDTDALTAQQRRGMEVFDQVGCDRCHDGVMFSDFDLHAEGVPEHPLLSEADAGAGRFRFRTPSLRNVALTAPYMHNGMLPTLDAVLRFYDNGRSENPNVSNDGGQRRNGGDGVARLAGQFRRVDDMTDRQMADIIAFLESLTDSAFDRAVPAAVPSGLTPGGRIGRTSVEQLRPE